MNITTEYKDITFLAYDDAKLKWYPLTKNYRSGMIQGWNKFCFVGGIVEISAELPGDANIGGLWPASKFIVVHTTPPSQGGKKFKDMRKMFVLTMVNCSVLLFMFMISSFFRKLKLTPFLFESIMPAHVFGICLTL